MARETVSPRVRRRETPQALLARARGTDADADAC
jgi:hypothetical protein